MKVIDNYKSKQILSCNYLSLSCVETLTHRILQLHALMAIMLSLTILLLSASSQRGVLCDFCPPTTFYIKPTDAANPDCPADCRCITLDQLATKELPDLRYTDLVTLVLLEGIHTSTVALNFRGIKHVVVTSRNGAASVWTDADPSQTQIRLLSSNISIMDASLIEVSNLVIDGGGESLFLMQHEYSGSCSILLDQVSMLRVVLRVQPLHIDALLDVTIVDSLFKVSRIEAKLCVYATFEITLVENAALRQSILRVKRTRFLTELKMQLGSVVVFSPDYFESQLLVFELENVTVSYLKDGTKDFVTSFPPSYFCDHKTKLQSMSEIHILSGNVKVSIVSSHFFGNIGTAVHAKNSISNISNCTFSGYSQGALVFSDSIDLKLVIDSTHVFNNTISSGDLMPAAAGLMISSYGQMDLLNCHFYNNVVLNRNLQIIKLKDAGQLNIHYCTFTNNIGTVINAEGTLVSFSGVVTFAENSAHQGGALSLSSLLPKIILLSEHTTVNFVNNSASQFGGAIYIDTAASIILAENDINNNRWCFYGPLTYTSSFEHVQLNFRNNSADKGGDHIYGISVKNYCKINSPNYINYSWKRLFHIEPNTTLSPVTSAALRTCMCDEHGQPQCAEESKIFATISRAVYPGEVFSISTVTVGAEFGTTVGEVYAKLLPGSTHNASFGNFQQYIQRITENEHCTMLYYSLHSRNSFEIMYMTVADWTLYTYGDVGGIQTAICEYTETDVVPRSLLTAPLFVNITLRFPCPFGFTLVGEPPYCDCYPKLEQKLQVNCTIKNGTGYVSRSGRIWIGVKGRHVIFYDLCPLSHCKTEKMQVDLENDSDSQCSYGHSGVLCGGCEEEYSVAIGSSNCLHCPNSASSLLIIFFVLAGPLLYLLISVLDLTITRGQINGLLLYANIVWIYQTVLFSVSTSKAAGTFKVFIAWLNLDFGIEMCFIKGLDAFWKSFLQYVFPIYIWIIAYVVVLVYRHTNIHQHLPSYASKLLGNSTHVLITFLLMSYTKFARTIINALRFSKLACYPSCAVEFVWALDGNVHYLSSKHVVLFTLALLAMIASFLSSTFIFIVGLKSGMLMSCQCDFSRIIRKREALDQTYLLGEVHTDDDHELAWRAKCTSRIHRCKKIFDIPLPLQDALFAPFNKNHKYWPGLMLFVRVALLILFTTTSDVSHDMNLFILLLVASLLLLYLTWNRVYSDQYIQMLEGLALGNIVLCSGGMIYANVVNREMWKSVVSCTTIGIAFIQFVGIIAHRIIRHCLKKQVVTHPTISAAQIDQGEEHDRNGSSQEQFLSASDWCESGIKDAR